MKGLYVLVTDGTRALCTDSGELVSHKLWPIARKAPKTQWPTALVKHATYGLWTLSGPQKFKRPFGLAKNMAMSAFVVDAAALDLIARQCKSVRSWHKHHAGYTSHALKIMSLEAPIESFELTAAHCIRAYKLSLEKVGPLDEVSSI